MNLYKGSGVFVALLEQRHFKNLNRESSNLITTAPGCLNHFLVLKEQSVTSSFLIVVFVRCNLSPSMVLFYIFLFLVVQPLGWQQFLSQTVLLTSLELIA